MEPKEILTKRKIEKLAEEYGYKGDLVEKNRLVMKNTRCLFLIQAEMSSLLIKSSCFARMVRG